MYNASFRWKNLQGALNDYKNRLAAALEIHAFNRDIDDINERIHEKAKMLSIDDLGKDLAAVEALQRKQEAIERDMTALQNQLEVGTFIRWPIFYKISLIQYLILCLLQFLFIWCRVGR